MAKIFKAALLLAIGALAFDAFAQWKPGEDVSGTKQIANYSYGIGRLEWTFPAGLRAIFAVPHFTAGPRVKCGDNRAGFEIECEVEVAPRNLRIALEERRRQLLATVQPMLAESKEKNAEVQTAGDLLYVILEHAKAAGPSRFFAMGFAHSSTALLKFHAKFADRAALKTFLDLVASVKAIDALEMWAWRLGDYREVCAERYPELKQANDRAFANSRFSSVDVKAFFLKRIQDATPEKVSNVLEESRKGFAAEFDKDQEERKRSFCEGFPAWVTEAAKGL
jgi:hypothetical protein